MPVKYAVYISLSVIVRGPHFTNVLNLSDQELSANIFLKN